MQKRKKAQGEIITLVILIVFILVSIIIVWNIVYSYTKNKISNENIDSFLINLKIEEVKLFITGGAEIRVSRKPGQGGMNSLRFIFTDKNGKTYNVDRQDIIAEGQIKTYTINQSEINNTSVIKEVEIAPVLNNNAQLKTQETKQTWNPDGNRAMIFPDSTNSVGKQMMQEGGLVSWWKFDDNAQDSVGNNHGTANGASFTNDPIRGKILNLAGGGQYVDVGNNANLNPETISVSAWINFNSVSPYNYIISNSRDCCPPYKGIDFRIINNNKLYTILWNTNSQSLQSNSALNSNQWYHVAFTYDGNIIKNYINSNLDNSENIGNSAIGSPASSNTLIGAMGVIPSLSLNGRLDEVMIFNRSLSDEEISAIYYLQKK